LILPAGNGRDVGVMPFERGFFGPALKVAAQIRPDEVITYVEATLPR
jgi:hypothetical protein